LENELIPTYYAKNDKGYSPEWIGYIKNSIAQIAPDYTMKRMLDDYIERFYHKLATRTKHLRENNFEKAKEIAVWKEEVAQHWDCFEVESFTCTPDIFVGGPDVGTEYLFKLVIDRKELKGMLGVDMIESRVNPESQQQEFIKSLSFKLIKEEGSKLYFELKAKPAESGDLKIGFRVYPYNKELPHRMDFAYIRWIQLQS
jgi:starch phosphorylase